MKVLVTGATGFIGSHLTEALLAKGASVRVLARDPARLRWIEGLEGIEVAPGSLEDQDALQKAVRDVEIIYHIAGVVKARHRSMYFEVNRQGTQRLLEAAEREANGLRRFVFLSSQAAVGPSPEFEPLDENAPPKPITPYGESKLAAEQIVLDRAGIFPVTLVRPSAVYGPRDSSTLPFFKLARLGIIPIPGLGKRMVSLVQVEDLVRGILLAGSHRDGEGKTFFITSGDQEWSQLAKALRAAVGRGRGVPVPAVMLKIAGLLSEAAACFHRRAADLDRHKAHELVQRSWLCSSGRARRVLGYRPRWSIEEGLAQTATWYRNAGWIRD